MGKHRSYDEIVAILDRYDRFNGTRSQFAESEGLNADTVGSWVEKRNRGELCRRSTEQRSRHQRVWHTAAFKAEAVRSIDQYVSALEAARAMGLDPQHQIFLGCGLRWGMTLALHHISDVETSVVGMNQVTQAGRL